MKIEPDLTNPRSIEYIDISEMSFRDACHALGERGEQIYKNYVLWNWVIAIYGVSMFLAIVCLAKQ